ncbi:hypothetical protein MASR1M31_07750 [Porphyromonadaceae bacterium]
MVNGAEILERVRVFSTWKGSYVDLLNGGESVAIDSQIVYLRKRESVNRLNGIAREYITSYTFQIGKSTNEESSSAHHPDR